jgi:hypothetical protein
LSNPYPALLAKDGKIVMDRVFKASPDLAW